MSEETSKSCIDMLLRCAQHNIVDEPYINLAPTVEQAARDREDDAALCAEFPYTSSVSPSDRGIDGVIPLADG